MNNKYNLILLLILISVIVFNQYQYSVKNINVEKKVFYDKNYFQVIDPALASQIETKDASSQIKDYLALALVKIELEKKEEPVENIKEIIKPEISVESWLAYNLTTKEEIFSHEADKIWPTASLAKLVTAVITTEEIGLDTPILITEEAINTEEEAGYFEVGEIFSARDLVTSLFLVSSNDASTALAQNIGYEKFISEMNKLARRLFMNQTFFVDPSGLSNKNITTANDLKLLIQYIYNNRPELTYFSRQVKAIIMDKAFSHVKNYENINKFAGTSNFIGGKTGYTHEARENLISIFSKDNQAILIIVLGSKNRFKDTETIINAINL